ncbi:MAG TPA: hypothetical protein PK644_00790, partial [bacterium]|nr:hypothetical protein [bacterium]
MHKHLLCWGLFLVAVNLCQAGPYRRFIEAEKMVAEGPVFRVKPETGSSGQAVMEVKTSAQAVSSARLVKPLEKSLPAGRYAVWVKLGPGLEKTSPEKTLQLRVGLGDTSGVVTFEKIKPATAAAVTINAVRPFQTIWLAVEKADFRFQLDQLYLTGRAEDIRLDPEEKTAEVDLPSVMKEMNPPAEHFPGFPLPVPEKEPDNWLENGGFEVGLGTYYWSTLYQQNYCLQPEFWSRQQPAEGERCLAIRLFPYASRFQGDRDGLPTLFQLLHKILKLQPEKTYYFRGFFRASAPVELTVSVTAAYQSNVRLGQVKATIGQSWQPVSMEFKTTTDNRGYFLSLTATSTSAATLYLDALTLSAEKREEFVPSFPVELGLHWDVPGRVFYRDEPARFLLLARNYGTSGQEATLSVRYRILDYFDRQLVEKTINNWPVSARHTGEKSLDLNPGVTGNFRLVLDGEVRTAQARFSLPAQEYVFSVLPRPPEKMQHTFGAYITLAPEPIAIMSRAGIRRTVTLSCSNELLQTWRSIEPRPGEFIWADKRVDFALAHDMDILANLDLGSGAEAIPVWARNPAEAADAISCSGPRIPKKPYTFSRKAWANFVEKMVEHYRGKISNWLIVDEPYHYMKPEEYVDLIKVSYQAAKKANPQCQLFIHGGYYPYWLPALEKAGAVPYFDAISDYARTPEQGQRLKEFARRHGKPVINVEYRWQVSMYRMIETPDYLETREVPWYREVVESILQEPIYAMCWSGGQGFNLYDARYPGGDFRQLDRYKCGFEYDGTLKPNMVGYAIMSQLLDGFRGVEELQLHPEVKTFLLEDRERFALVLWTKDRKVLETEWRLPEKVQALDIMGNPCPVWPQPVLLSNALTYLLGPKSSLEKTRQLLSGLKTQEAVRLTTAIVSGKDGQYLFRVNLTNNCRQRSISGQLQLTDIPLRDFWQRPIVSFSSLAPGKSFTFDFGLNAYQPESVPEQFDGALLLYFEGVTFHQALKSPGTILKEALKTVECLVKEKNYPAAEEFCRNSLTEQKGENRSRLLLKLAQILKEQGKNEESLATYREVAAAAVSPDILAEAWYQQARILFPLKKDEEALVALKKAASLPEEVPSVLAAGYEAGRYHFLKREYEQAIKEYSKVLARAQSEEAYRIPEVACSLLYRGKSFHALKKLELAIKDYESLISRPGVPGPYLQD